MKRKKYYNRNGWGIESREVIDHGQEKFKKDLINRERFTEAMRKGKNQ